MKYIHVLMMCLALMLSISAQAQKQKKQKEPKKEKVQKEKKQKESKQKESKKKDQFVSFADVKVAKKGTVEYNAQRQAAFQVMDSLLHHTRTNDESRKYFGRVYQENDLVRFADAICEKFDNDPVLMDSIAASFFGTYSNEFLGHKRFRAIKEMYPKYVDAYYTEMLMYHSLAWREAPKFDPYYRQKAKEQIDSAKLIDPTSPDPYMRWARYEGKYNPDSIFTEIDTLKMRIPNYPGYLQIAIDFSLRSDDDRSFLPSARKMFQRAERESMNLGHYQMYSSICYRIGSSQKLKEDFQEGIDIAKEGLSKFPKDPQLLRYRLWNQGFLPTVPSRTIDGERVPQLTAEEKQSAWDSAYVAALEFNEVPDTFKRTATDFRWMGQANMETKHFAEAIVFFKKQLEAGVTDSTQYVTALLNIINCNRQLSEYDDAISAFAHLEQYKHELDMELDATDYNSIVLVYRSLLRDTLRTNEERINAFEKMVPFCLAGARVSPENAFVFENRILGDNNNILLYCQLKNGVIDVTDESFKMIVEEVINFEKDYQATLEPSSIPHDRLFSLMTGYRWLMNHYYFFDRSHPDYEAKMRMAFDISKIMLDMPLYGELTELTDGQRRAYMDYWNEANEYYTNIKNEFKYWK